MQILIIDSQGGGLGKLLITKIKQEISDVQIMAVGTNTAATAAMLKAGADHAATGENAAVLGCKKCDVILGPVGIAIADSMYGEISSKIAKAVGKSPAKRILIPFSHCDTILAGMPACSLSALADAAVDELKKLQ